LCKNELVTKVIKETAEQIEIDKIKEAQRSEIDEESDFPPSFGSFG
jgi:hypothetical protein